MTGTGGSAPFDNHGSIVYKTRAVDAIARSSHIFYTGRTSAERVRIDHDGNMGIGTDTPGGQLHVKSSGGTNIFVDGATDSFQSYAFKSGGSTKAEVKNFHETRMEFTQTGGTYRFNTISGTQYFEINSSGIEAKVGNISGSATLTGSFGSLVVADAIQGRTEIKGNFVPRGALNSGTNNVVIGDGAYSSGVSGVRNVVIGQNASGGGTMTDVDDSVIIGYRAGYKLIDGYYNVYIGTQAGYSNTTSNTNVGIGYNALYTDGSIYGNNVAIGHNALYLQSGSSSQMDNTAIGASAGASVTTGARQVFVGYAAGTATTTGAYNTMVGWRAGYSNTTGAYNTFLGNYAANSNLTGTQNIAIGNQAAYGGTKANK